MHNRFYMSFFVWLLYHLLLQSRLRQRYSSDSKYNKKYYARILNYNYFYILFVGTKKTPQFLGEELLK